MNPLKVLLIGFHCLLTIVVLVIISLVLRVHQILSTTNFHLPDRQNQFRNRMQVDRDAHMTDVSGPSHSAKESDDLLMDNMNLSYKHAMQLYYISLRIRIDPSQC